MFDFSLPRYPIGSEQRQEASRSEMRSAMHMMIGEAIKSGWLEGELTMALADVAEEHVISLAERKAPNLYLVPAVHR